ncbi:hypothetical protein AB1E19_010529 [Capra hircus]
MTRTACHCPYHRLTILFTVSAENGDYRESAGSMGKWGNQGKGATELEAPMPTFQWEKIQKHNLCTDKWLVINRKVFNVTKRSSRHPEG